MRPFDELTESELAALTDEDLSRHVDLRCAELGIPLIPIEAPKPPQLLADPEPDVTTYNIGGFAFFAEEDANKVRQALIGTTLVNKDYLRHGNDVLWGHPQVCTQEHELPEVQPVKLFSQDSAARNKAAIAERDAAKKLYEEARDRHARLLARRSRDVIPSRGDQSTQRGA